MVDDPTAGMAAKGWQQRLPHTGASHIRPGIRTAYTANRSIRGRATLPADAQRDRGLGHRDVPQIFPQNFARMRRLVHSSHIEPQW